MNSHNLPHLVCSCFFLTSMQNPHGLFAAMVLLLPCEVPNFQLPRFPLVMVKYSTEGIFRVGFQCGRKISFSCIILNRSKPSFWFPRLQDFLGVIADANKKLKQEAQVDLDFGNPFP